MAATGDLHSARLRANIATARKTSTPSGSNFGAPGTPMRMGLRRSCSACQDNLAISRLNGLAAIVTFSRLLAYGSKLARRCLLEGFSSGSRVGRGLLVGFAAARVITAQTSAVSDCPAVNADVLHLWVKVGM